MSKIDEANRAAEVLKFPGFDAAFQAVKDAYLASMSDPRTDDATAQAIRHRLIALKDVRADLERAVNTGKLEVHELARVEKRKHNLLRTLYR